LYVLTAEQTIPRQRHEIFEFFAKPENLDLLTPPDLGFSMLTPKPVTMRRGALIDYVIRLAGIQVRWRTVISEYEPESRFIDEQLLGPYSFWHHTHSFAAVEGGTLIQDEVRYLPSFGPVGRMLHPLFIKPRLEQIFAYRRRAIEKLFGETASRPMTTEDRSGGK
jgi:ligand-binding SRPBCC domain-containing protein